MDAVMLDTQLLSWCEGCYLFVQRNPRTEALVKQFLAAGRQE